MKYFKLPVGVLQANCYIAYCEESNEAAIIDPGGDAKKITEFVKKSKLKPICIINTHGHADHMAGNSDLRKLLNLPVYIHKEDANMLVSAKANLSNFIGAEVADKEADKLLADGDVVKIGKEELKVIHTPGHTRGGICLLADNVIFTGDTVFAGGEVGRTDLPGGSYEQLVSSIREKLWILPEELVVCPGHDADSTIGREKRMNNYVKTIIA